MVQDRFRFRVLTHGLLALSLVGSAVFLSAQDAKTTLIEPPPPLLPHNFGPWQTEAAAPPSDSFQPQGETAAVFKEDGLKRAIQQTYHQQGNSETMNVEAYQFLDATGAYSAFTFLRSPGMKGLPSEKVAGAETVAKPGGEFLVWRGTTVVKAIVSRVRPSTSDELRQLALTLPKVGGPKGLPPLLPTYLPQKGLVQDSVRYSLGPVSYLAMGGTLPGDHLGFDKAAEVLSAKYAGQGLLTLLMFPTPQIAGDRGRTIASDLTQQGSSAGTVKLRREGPLLLLTTGSWNPTEAQAVVDGIHLRNEVTWNKQVPPEFHTEVQKTVSLLTSILIFCGLGALAAIVLGLFFGGGRAAIRVLQGKPAATEPEFLRIDLSGRPHPIRTDAPPAGSRG
jgi:hypothetical protein